VFTSAIIQDILRDIRHDPAYSRVEFRVDDLPSCHADPLFVKQVFTNLISNALKFTRTRDMPEIEIGSLFQDGRQMFSVRDNGVGFDMRYSQKIFGVFERLHDEKEYEGTGVGLAIVHRIIEMHGGIIRVESEPGRGTTFLFTFGD
jgi:light-regulated signal transduction histidine kinase (bacteriophytochrome)